MNWFSEAPKPSSVTGALSRKHILVFQFLRMRVRHSLLCNDAADLSRFTRCHQAGCVMAELAHVFRSGDTSSKVL